MATRTPAELELFGLVHDMTKYSYSKCWRMVDAYLSRHISSDEYQRISYADPTGERATFRAFITSLKPSR